MAKEQKDKIPVVAVTSTEEVMLGLWLSVAKREIGMSEAALKLRLHVDSLSEEKQDEFRLKARPWGMWLMSISEAFLQELTVIGASK